MSALINDKSLPVRRHLRWPFSTAFTLSMLSLSLLLLLWWGVTALGLIAPLFLPSPQQVLSKLLLIASAQGFMDATLWQHLAASLTRMLIALTAAAAIG
ncbi:MAG: taurine transporter subunit, partial [Pantoea agglomerans]